MKKLLSLFLCAALLCALCACGGQVPAVQDAVDAQDDSSAVQDNENAGVSDAGQDGGGEETPAGTETPSETEDSAGTETPAAAAGGTEENTETQTSGTQSGETQTAKTNQTQKPATEKTGGKTASQPAGKPAATESTATETTATETTATESTAPAADPKTVAQGLVGRPVSELYAAIGRPISSDYAPSCLIDGEDGELIYDGFTVYTEKGSNYETVYAVF